MAGYGQRNLCRLGTKVTRSVFSDDLVGHFVGTLHKKRIKDLSYRSRDLNSLPCPPFLYIPSSRHAVEFSSVLCPMKPPFALISSCWPCYERAKKCHENANVFSTKAQNVESIKPQLVTPKAQHRQCQLVGCM